MRPVRRQQWKAAITTTPALTATTRITLLEIATLYMTSNGVIVRGVDQMTGISLSARQLARHLQVAYESAFLDQTAAGYRGQAATYQAVIPDPGERQERRPRNGERLTQGVSQLDRERLTLSSSHYAPERLTSDVSPLKNYRASLGEHVAVEEDAPGEDTTTAGATHLAIVETATAHRREEPVTPDYRFQSAGWGEHVAS